MAWFKENWFRIFILIAIFYLTFNIGTYLKDKIAIEARVARVKCYFDFEKNEMNPTNLCSDIALYKERKFEKIVKFSNE